MANVLRDKVVLIGMPGSGKTTIGKVLAKELSYNFYDMDIYIEKKNKRKIKDIFNDGEDCFRKLETEACRDLSLKKRAIISSGGGVVTRKENIEILKKDCIIIFIDRPTEDIVGDVDIESRPLLKDGRDKIYKLYEDRYNLYVDACDVVIKNNEFLRDAVNEMLRYLKNKIKE